MSEKTEEPTPKRLRKARKDGDSPVSAALVQAVGFVAVVAAVPWFVGATAERFNNLVKSALDGSAGVESLGSVVWLTLPIVGIAGAAALATGLVQTGGILAPKRVSPDLSKLNPAKGLKNLFSAQRSISVVRSLAAALVVAWICWEVITTGAASLAASVGNIPGAAVAGGALTGTLLRAAATVGVALAILDVMVTRWSWKKRLRMSKDEVKREHKESEGDPEIKQARQRAHQEMLRGATIDSVRKATVLIVNPTHLATALKYEDDEGAAPEIVAQGRGELAQLMQDAARAYGVPIVRDVPVARALMELEVGEEIPEALYEAVAAILREVWEAEEPGPSGPSEANDGGEEPS